jgi:hypothetical protein
VNVWGGRGTELGSAVPDSLFSCWAAWRGGGDDEDVTDGATNTMVDSAFGVGIRPRAKRKVPSSSITSGCFGGSSIGGGGGCGGG